MKRFKKSLLSFLAVVFLLTLFVSADSNYSTADDPLVSLSYVNNVLKPQIISEVLNEVKSQYPSIGVPNSGAQSTYTLVELKKGGRIEATGCCEIIMTYGSSSAFVTSSDNMYAGVGLDDLTVGKRLLDGDLVMSDHYIVIPKGDGRGVSVTSDSAYFLVRGEYNIK